MAASAAHRHEPGIQDTPHDIATRRQVLEVLDAPGATLASMSRAVLWIGLLTTLLACGEAKSSSGKPGGTMSDPVVKCERFADVCKLDGSRLGVCATARSGSGFVCASQH